MQHRPQSKPEGNTHVDFCHTYPHSASSPLITFTANFRYINDPKLQSLPSQLSETNLSFFPWAPPPCTKVRRVMQGRKSRQTMGHTLCVFFFSKFIILFDLSNVWRVASYILSCSIVAFCGKVNPKPVALSWLELFLEIKVSEMNFEIKEEERKNRTRVKTLLGAFVKNRKIFSPAWQNTKGILLWEEQLTIDSSSSGLTPHARIHRLENRVQAGSQNSVRTFGSDNFV